MIYFHYNKKNSKKKKIKKKNSPFNQIKTKLNSSSRLPKYV